MNKTYFAYRLPHSSEVKYLKGDLVQRENITELMGRGIVLCDFHSEMIYQLENTEECDISEFQNHYSNRNNTNTSKETYSQSFERLQAEMEGGRFDKLVLTKIKEVPLSQDAKELYNKLNKTYLNTFNYYLSSPELGSWMGATPETLCEIKGDQVMAVSLAGTKKPDESWTDKEIEEQIYVTRYIEDKLQDLHCSNIEVDGPHSISAGPVQHLNTVITGTLLSREIWRKVIEDLHPTPATCGIPAKTSKDFIKDLEDHDRSIYTGFIGVFGDESKICFVNLRCMELFEDRATIFVGGGITKASTLEKEWQETERKASTLERILAK